MYYTDKVPAGYDLVDGKPVVNPVTSQLVKLVFEKAAAYEEHPPVELVQNIIEEYHVVRNKQLSYEEAEKLVLRSSIDLYLDHEVKAKSKLYKLSGEKGEEAMREIIALSVDEVDRRINELKSTN